MESVGTTEYQTTRDGCHGLSHDDIRDQLKCILGHREFKATEKMMDLLRFVVEETLAGRKHLLNGYAIATRVFGRGVDFNAAHDPIVSIQAGRLRRALERYYLVEAGKNPIRIDIPKGGYVPTFVEQVERKIEPSKGMRQSVERVGEPGRGPTVAVLPFDNLNGDPDQVFLATGLMEELATEMNRFQDIIVIPCHRMIPGDRLAESPVELARFFGARFALHGSLRRDPKTVKVSTHLLDAENGKQIWAESYTHPLEASRLIATQEEIAGCVVAAIASEYGTIARRLSAESRKKAPAELDTYEAMLRYYSHQIAPSPESGMECFLALQRAVESEPEYGPAWSALATLHCQMYTFDVPGFEEALQTALRHARHGVFLEPGSQLGRLILAYASYLAEDSESFEQEIETALALNPNSPYAIGTAGYFHAMQGEFDRGLPLLDRAIALNPCHPDWFHMGYFLHHLSCQDYEGALLELEKHTPLHSFWLDVAFAAVLAKLGRIDEAMAHSRKTQKLKPDFASRARALLRRTIKIDPIIDDVIDGLNRCQMG